MKKPEKEKRHHSFFTNRACEYFPCHVGIDPENFNCLFCYCPLYPLGETCGGAFVMLEGGVKDCSSCTLPHKIENYDKIVGEFQRITALFPGK